MKSRITNYSKLLFIVLCIVMMITSSVMVAPSRAMMTNTSTGLEEDSSSGDTAFTEDTEGSGAFGGEIDSEYKQEMMQMIQEWAASNQELTSDQDIDNLLGSFQQSGEFAQLGEDISTDYYEDNFYNDFDNQFTQQIDDDSSSATLETADDQEFNKMIAEFEEDDSVNEIDDLVIPVYMDKKEASDSQSDIRPTRTRTIRVTKKYYTSYHDKDYISYTKYNWVEINSKKWYRYSFYGNVRWTTQLWIQVPLVITITYPAVVYAGEYNELKIEISLDNSDPYDYRIILKTTYNYDMYITHREKTKVWKWKYKWGWLPYYWYDYEYKYYRYFCSDESYATSYRYPFQKQPGLELGDSYRLYTKAGRSYSIFDRIIKRGHTKYLPYYYRYLIDDHGVSASGYVKPYFTGSYGYSTDNVKLSRTVRTAWRDEDYNARTLRFRLPSSESSSSIRFFMDDVKFGYNWGYVNLRQFYDFNRPGLSSDYTNNDYTRLSLKYSGYIQNRDYSWKPYVTRYDDVRFSTNINARPTANYDFTVAVTPITLPYQEDTTRNYNVALTSQGNYWDYINLEVSGLPTGYNYTFSRDPARYFIRPGRTITVRLTITSPVPSSTAPDPVHPVVRATSEAKTTLHHYQPTISQAFEYVPPVLHGMTLESTVEKVELELGDSMLIDFSGINTGNMNDNITVQGIITGPEGVEFDNSTTFIDVSRYSTADHGFNGVYNITYAPGEVYPTPGDYELYLIANSDHLPDVNVTVVIPIVFVPYRNLTAEISPVSIVISAKYERVFTLTVTNTGNAVDNFTLAIDGWSTYLDYDTNVTDIEPGETREIFIGMEVPDPYAVSLDDYTFRVITRSEGDSGVYVTNEVTVDYREPDYAAPGLDRIYDGRMLVYPVSILNLGPAWTVEDSNPTTYEIFVNNTPYDSGDWTSGDTFQVLMKDVDGYAAGNTFNVTAVFNDVSGNTVIDTAWVMIDPADLTPPAMDASLLYLGWYRMLYDDPMEDYPGLTPDQVVSLPQVTTVSLPVNWNYTYGLNWECTEVYPYNITLMLNGTAINVEDYAIWQDGSTGTGMFNLTYNLVPESLPIGLWNFTLEIRDMTGYNVTSTILVDILSADNTLPALSSTPESSVSQGIDELIGFAVSDSTPYFWEISFNSIAFEKKFLWQDNVAENIAVDEMPLRIGTNDVVLSIYDHAGNVFTHSWTVTVDDPVIPVINSPSDFSIYESNETIDDLPVWTAEDLNPAEYRVYRDSVLIDEGVWSLSNNTVTLPLEGLLAGSYLYNVVFTDTSGNEASDDLTLTVIDDIAPAALEIDPFYFEQYVMASWFEFNLLETNSGSYQLYRNNSLLNSGGAFTPDFPYILVDLLDTPTGYNNFTLVMTDSSGNTGIESVGVTAVDFSPPYIEGPQSLILPEGETDRNITWTVQEVTNWSYSLYHNGSSLDTGDMPAGTSNVSLNLVGFGLGFHEIVITVTDGSNFTHSLTTYVQVVDFTPPQISMLGDYNAEPGDPNAVLTWTITEPHPASYQLLVDGNVVQEGPWTGDDIELQLVGWALGTYEVTLVVIDSSGNAATNVLTVTIAKGALTSAPFESPFGDLFTILLALGISTAVTNIFRKRKRH